MSYKAEDVGGLSPSKDDNTVGGKMDQKDELVFKLELFQFNAMIRFHMPPHLYLWIFLEGVNQNTLAISRLLHWVSIFLE